MWEKRYKLRNELIVSIKESELEDLGILRPSKYYCILEIGQSGYVAINCFLKRLQS
jgi:hypothetical protein